MQIIKVLATLLQRAERHEEAINHYNMAALSLNDANPTHLSALVFLYKPLAN